MTPGLPSGWAQNDIFLLFVSYERTSVTINTPSGWANVTGSPSDLTGNFRMNAYWKRAGSSESAPSVTQSNSQSIDSGATIFAFRGCATSGNPYDVSTSATKTSTSTSLSWPSVTTTVSDTLVVQSRTGSVGTVASYSNAALGSLTERHDAANGFRPLVVVTGIKASAGSTGSTTATASSTSQDVYYTIALKSVGGAIHSANVTSTVTNTRTAALGATDKSASAARTATATLASALAGTAKPVDASRSVTATTASALGVIAKPIAVTRAVTATTAADATLTLGAQAARPVTATITAAAEQFPGIKQDFASGTDAAVTIAITTADTGSAADATAGIEPAIEDTGDEQIFIAEDTAAVAFPDADTGTGDEDQATESTLLDADTASSAEGQFVAPDEQVADADTATGTETPDAFTFEPKAGSDAVTAADAGVADTELSDDDPAIADEDHSVLQLTTSDIDTTTITDAQEIVADVSSDDICTAAEAGGAEFFLDDDDPATADESTAPADAIVLQDDTGSAAEADSTDATAPNGGDVAQGIEVSPALRFITNKHLVSSRQ